MRRASLLRSLVLPTQMRNSFRYMCETSNPHKDKYFHSLLRQYPNIAGKGSNIEDNYDILNARFNSIITRTHVYGAHLTPTAALGRHINKKSEFQFRFSNQDEEMVVKYGSTLVGTGVRAELGVRAGYYFSTGISQILPEIPKTLEIKDGWEISALQLHITKFQVHELPTQTFWGISANVGLGIGFQSIHGVLYLNDKKAEKQISTPNTKRFWDNIHIVRGVILVTTTAILALAISSLTSDQQNKIGSQKYIPTLKPKQKPLPADLVTVGKLVSEASQK